jgi:hypothetical protein
MQWLQTNWIWLALVGAFIAMHLSGHGMHGGHGRHNRDRSSDPDNTNKEVTTGRPVAGQVHQVASVPSVGTPDEPAAAVEATDQTGHGSPPTASRGQGHKHGC